MCWTARTLHGVKTDAINGDIPAAGLLPFSKQGLGASKKSLNNTVKVPVTATDFSSIVAAAKDADYIITSIPDHRSIQAYLANSQTLGFKEKVYTPPGGARTSRSSWKARPSPRPTPRRATL